MNTRCNAGDLAIVIHDTPECATNVGRLVRVRGPLVRNCNYRLDCWLIKPVHPALWKVDRWGKVSAESVYWKSQIEHPDAWLFPIRPEEADRLSELAYLDLDRFLASLRTDELEVGASAETKEGA